MPLFLHTSWQPKETHEDPHWRENTQVCSVWLFFHSLSEAGKSHADPYRRCVINVLIPVLSLKIWKYTSANTQERNLSTWPTWSYLCSSWHSESTHARNPTYMSSVTIPVLMLLVWSDIGSNTLEKSLSSVTSATILALKLVIWKYTNANTQEKNLSTVTNVTTPVLGPNVWKYTSVTTQERNPSNVTSAVTLANNQVTCSGTRGRCTRQQKTCKNKQFRLYWTGHYFFFVHADRK